MLHVATSVVAGNHNSFLHSVPDSGECDRYIKDYLGFPLAQLSGFKPF
ncbi:MAG: hypothetical protein V7K32_02325 [Nostoc sp.]